MKLRDDKWLDTVLRVSVAAAALIVGMLAYAGW